MNKIAYMEGYMNGIRKLAIYTGGPAHFAPLMEDAAKTVARAAGRSAPMEEAVAGNVGRTLKGRDKVRYRNQQANWYSKREAEAAAKAKAEAEAAAKAKADADKASQAAQTQNAENVVSLDTARRNEQDALDTLKTTNDKLRNMKWMASAGIPAAALGSAGLTYGLTS